MKRRLLSILLTLGMILSLLPVTALAATGYDDNWYHYRQKWMYKVTASKEATANEKTINIGENIRETTDTAGHGTIPTIEFGAVTYGNADKNPLTLTFTNTTEDEDIVGAGDTNPNNWGKVYVTIGSKSKYFDFKWDSKNGQINKGESSTVTITPRNDIPAGPQEETVVFMEQNSRVGWSVKLQVTMEPTPVTVTPATAVNKYYGQTLKPSDIGIAEITGDGVSKEDFKTLAALGLSEVPGEKDHVKENVGTYNLTYGEPQTIGKYKITFNGNTEVTVKQATPVPKWVNASGVVYNGELRSSQITGDYVNPYTGEKVNGDFTWLGGTAGQQLIASGEHDYTFTPTDGNHTTATGKVFVAVGGDVTGGSSGSSGRPITTVLTVDAHIEEEYNAQPKTVKVDVTSGYPTEKLEFKYRKQGTEPWMEGKPIDAGTYDIMITAPVTANYTGASTTTSLTIKPKKLDVVFQVYNKFFDNDVDAQLSIVGDPYIYDRDKDKFTLTGKEIQKYVTKVEFEDAQAGVDKTVNIVVDEVTLEGEGASNYCLPAGTYTAKATISPRSVQLNVGAQAVKYYGQTMTFVPSDFTATPANEKDGLIAGDVIDSLEATFSSEGTNPIAPVDSYSVTAASSSKNYKIEKVEGTMKVAPAMPEGTVAALKGAANAELSTIAASLTGTFMNPYNGEPVPGKVTWKDDTQSISGTINETKSFEYIFTPEDKTNYVTVTGKVDVTAANGVPAPIVVEGNTSLVYTGDPQPIKIKEVDKVEFTVKYSSKDQEDWGDEAPRDVGSYQAKITATAEAAMSTMTPLWRSSLLPPPPPPSSRAASRQAIR